MRTFFSLSTLVLILAMSSPSFAQDFSNKGKDFWVGYGYHERMGAGGGGSQDMVLYFATEAVTSVTVSIPTIGYSVTYSNIPANTVFTSAAIPKTGAQDARLTSESASAENKGIHITSDRPIVAYAHIYNQSVSGATILFPTNTLGKQYYSVNYKNVSNSNNANCWFYVIACDTGTTKVEITPSAATINHAAGIPFSISLTQGQVFNVMGQFTNPPNPNPSGITPNGVDLTGSTIKSISSGAGGCKRIAVFSGSGRICITCNNTVSSSDNYMVQAFPQSAWGKKYLTAPTGGVMSNNIFRICVSDPAANVTVNGAPIAVPLVNNFYYELAASSAPNLIESDKPILVVQYITSQGACGNGAQPGDPEVIYLSPVEQNINKVLWNATPNYQIVQHFFNAIIPNTGTAISSFKLDGVAVPPASFIAHPQAPGYSYLVQGVGPGQHIITSDSGFNAIAYGFGNAESYGYNAGTNVKDLYQFVSIKNQYATVNYPAACRNSPFYFSMTFPYEPTEIEWDFGGILPNVTIFSPVYDSTWIFNGKQLFMYKLPTAYSIATPGTYPIKITAQNPTSDGCSGEQEIFYDLQVYERPVADFNFVNTGCATSLVNFTDNSNPGGRTITSWYWDFGDGNNSTANNPSHNYGTSGSYDVKYSIITDIGCLSDTALHTVNLNGLPLAKFGVTSPYCAGKLLSFTDSSSISAGNTIVKWYWDFGDGSPQVTALSNAAQTHSYAVSGLYNVTLKVESAAGCQSTVYTLPVNVRATPVAAFNLPNVCLPVGSASFTSQSSISDGTQGLFTYSWNFGDGGSSTAQNPSHIYSSTGPFNITLTVTSNNGCMDDSVRSLATIFAEPHADFTQDSIESCLGGTVNFTDLSTAAGSTVNQWFWSFGDATTSILQNPNKQYAAPGVYTVKLYINSAIGCRSDTMTKVVTVLSLPSVSFTNSSPVCESGNILFTSTSVPNAGVFSQYNWTVNGSAQGANSNTLNYIPVGPGNYTIGLNVVTNKGCIGQLNSIVAVHPKPVASFNLPIICMPAGTANFTSSSAISDGSQALFTYAWNFGDGGTATSQNPSHNYAGTGPYNVTLVVTSNNGCADDSIRVLNTINPEPQAAFTAPAEVCLGSSISFTDISTASGSTVSQWFWDFGDATTSNSQNPVKNYLSAGTYTVKLNIRSANGCQTVGNFATRTVIVNPLPVANFNTSLPACITRNISLSDASVPNAGALIKWTWTYGDGNNAVLNSAAPFNHIYNAAGNYNVTLQVETDKGCKSPVISKQVSINILPVAAFSVPVACSSDPAAPFLDASNINSGTISGWNWDFGDPNANAGNPNTSGLQNPTHGYTVAGPYTATLVVTSNNGCTDTIRKTFNVNGSPVSTFTLQNPLTLCSNKTVSITDGTTISFGNVIKTEIYWDYSNDPTIKTVDNTPVPGRVYSYTYPEFGVPATRAYQVRYVVYSGINCISVFTKNITLLATPSLQFTPVTGVCANVSPFLITQVQLLNVLPGSGAFSGTGISPAGLFSPTIAGAGSHIIRYTYTGTNGCSNFIEQVQPVYPMPGTNAGPDKVVLEGGAVTLTPAVNASFPVTYTWSPPLGLSNPNISSPSSSPSDDVTYTLTVTSDKGCQTSDQVYVKVLRSPVIPNIFSPNGDGIHDTWEITSLESYPGATVEIYNRYGQLVFHCVGYTQPWDGTINGKPAPIGTYYYIIDPKNGRKKEAGYVDIIR